MEGGLFQWKIQKLNISRGPVADYSDISRPLPDPPKGMVWRRDEETRGFSLSKEKESSSFRNLRSNDIGLEECRRRGLFS